MSDDFFTWLLWLAPALASVPAAKGLVHLFQLSSYQYGGYVQALRRRWKRELLPGVMLAVVSFAVCVAADYLARAGGRLWLAIGAALTLAAGFALGYGVHNRRRSVKPLHYTARVRRLFAALLVVMVVLALVLRKILPVMGISALLPLFVPVWVALAALLTLPVEHLIKHLYQRDARRILDAQKGLIRIAITGSYGKTSVKFFLETMLRQRYSVLATRGSFNTPMGITRVIREDMEPAHRVFIAEMGARHRHDIRELCRLVQPQIGILTAVGPQHLETFGSVERVRETKYDLIRALPKDGLAVFINDGAIVRDLYGQTGDKPRLIVGQPGDDLWAEGVEATLEGTAFLLCLKDGTRLRCHTRLIGEHNLQNVLLAAAVARHLGLSDAQLRRGIEALEPVAARFKPEKTEDGRTIINNGFNANPQSSRAALALLKDYPGRRIVVTPGFVELGEQESAFNRQLGERMAASADVALLVGPKHTLPIREGLLGQGFAEDNIHTFLSLKEAQAWLDENKAAGDVVLYENDLPDHYNEA